MPSRFFPRFLLSFLSALLAALLAVPMPAAAQAAAKKKDMRPKWRMHFTTAAGELTKKQTTMRVSVDGERILCNGKSGKTEVVVSIPISSITGFAYSDSGMNPALLVIGGAGILGVLAATANSDGHDDDIKPSERLAVGGAGLVLLLLVAAFHHPEHIIAVDWEEDGVTKRAVFKTQKRKKALAFLNDLRNLTGKEPLIKDEDLKESFEKERKAPPNDALHTVPSSLLAKLPSMA
jgi:hypothetical protein